MGVIEEPLIDYRQHGNNMTGRSQEMAYYYARTRWKAWHSAQNTARQRRVSRHVWLRLQLRAVLWTGMDTARAARARNWPTSRAGLGALWLFVRQLLHGHPTEPTEASAAAIVRFVVPHSAGEGSLARAS